MAAISTNLQGLKTYCKGLLSDVNYTDDELNMFISKYGSPSAEYDKKVVELAIADFLEAVATSLDYAQGEVSRKYDRQALLSVANGLRAKNKDVQIADILGDEI